MNFIASFFRHFRGYIQEENIHILYFCFKMVYNIGRNIANLKQKGDQNYEKNIF